MADALGSGPSGLNARGGSSPLARTRIEVVPGKRNLCRALLYLDSLPD